MKKFLVVLSVIGMFFAVSGNVQASVIVDTGDPTTPGWGLTKVQWLAGEFTTSQAYSITDISGWIREDGGTITLALYGDGSGVPGTWLHSGSFAVPYINGLTNSPYGWHGLSGLDWDIPAGTYWAAFEVHAENTYSGGMGGFPPNPLAHDTWANYGEWTGIWGTHIGLKVQDTTGEPVTPEPATMVLFGIGSAAMAFARRKKKLA